MQMKSKDSADQLPWGVYETVLLDMDGTILDLAYDNYFWQELVPRCYARSRKIGATEAREYIFSAYADKAGTLDWYCLDFWTAQLQLDIENLKAACCHRIAFLPGAREFLLTAQRQSARIILVTNAHRGSLDLKAAVVGLNYWIKEQVSSHDLGVPKEDPGFWVALQKQLGFNPATTVFVDDSLPVLNAAKNFGIGKSVAVRFPDSRKKAKDVAGHFYIDGLGQWAKAIA